MAPNIKPNTTNCPNCGAVIQDSLISTIKVCEYCGTKLNAGEGSADKVDTLIARINIGPDRLSQALAQYLNEPMYYRLPISLADVTITSSVLNYYPAYVYRGSYKGEWKLKDGSGRGGTLDDDFSVTVYACTIDSIIQSGDVDKASKMALRNDEAFSNDRIDVIDTKYLTGAVTNSWIKPDDTTVYDEGQKPGNYRLYDFGMDEDQAWRMNGKKLLNDVLGGNIGKQLNNSSINENAEYRMHYQESFSKKTRVYIPIWEVAYTYNGHLHYVALPATNGPGQGDELVVKAPDRAPNGWEVVLSAWFLVPLWIVWGIVRMALPESSYLHYSSKPSANIFLSGDTLHFYVRQGLILFIGFVIFPALRKMIRNRRINNAIPDMADNADYVTGSKTLNFS